jgi:predicted RNase H-like HicB family nuclease
MKTTVQNLTLTVQVFREGKNFVSFNPELKVASCGKNIEEAKENLKEAISGFLKSAKKINTLEEIMEEAGFSYKKNQWLAPDLLVMDRLSLAF